MGSLFGLPMGKLDTIEYEKHSRADDCCLAMLSEWLQSDSTASWDKVHKAVNLLAGHSTSESGTPSMVPTVKAFLKKHYTEGVSTVKTSVSYKPSLQPKPGSLHHPPSLLSKAQVKFTRLVFMIHDSNGVTREDATSLANVLHNGRITIGNNRKRFQPPLHDSSYYLRCKQYTDIVDILIHLNSHKPFLLLLEGGPGMGKTTVCREVANSWGNSTTAMYEFVFLICLHLPSAQKIDSFESFFEVVCPGNQKRYSQDTLDYLSHTRGKNVLVIIDGFDELFDKQGMSQSVFLDDLINHSLPQFQLCDLIISSRQPMSARLYNCTNCTRVEILGYTDDLIHEYVQKNSIKSADKVTKHLEENRFLKSICYCPFLLECLVSLIETSKLPSNETTIIDMLVCSMIMWYCKEQGFFHNTVNGLPAKQQLLLKQVSKLAYYACRSGTMTFSHEDFSEDFQTIFSMYGSGFLKVFVLADTDEMFTFIHCEIQEFLCAFYLTTLSSSKQEKFRIENMWKFKSLNIWFHYCAMVKRNNNIINASLSDSWISLPGVMSINEILRDKMKCLYLLYCFMQSPDNPIYRHIKPKVLIDKNIFDVSNHKLTAEGLDIISLFLSRYSLKKWKCLNFSKCCLSNGQLIQILCLLQDLSLNTVCIDALDFADNNINFNKETLLAITNIPNTQRCIISHNKIKDEDINSIA